MKAIQHFLFGPIFIFILRPLIKRNYQLREQGLLPDKWYWADELSCDYGWYVNA